MPESSTGSSPLTRGGLQKRRTKAGKTGLIPAYAGRTCRCRCLARRGWAHPRLRGADGSLTRSTPTASGSSPLTRGGLSEASAKADKNGLIPAYAGRTTFTSFQSISNGAHPRLRGADPGVASARRRFRGSSPLTRGGPVNIVKTIVDFRLIPAYAGRTLIRFSFLTRSTAHPRLRGADSSSSSSARVAGGSSPLTRGGLFDSIAPAMQLGLIPAYAGRTIVRASPSARHRAHPRLRGADQFYDVA